MGYEIHTSQLYASNGLHAQLQTKSKLIIYRVMSGSIFKYNSDGIVNRLKNMHDFLFIYKFDNDLWFKAELNYSLTTARSCQHVTCKTYKKQLSF